MNTHHDQNPQTLSLHPDRPGVAGIRKNVAYLALFAIAGLIGLALVIGLNGGSRRQPAQREVEVGFHEAKPSQIDGLPDSYADIPQDQTPTTQQTPDGDHTDKKHSIDTQQLALLQAQNTQLRQQVTVLSQAIDKIGVENKKLIGQINILQEQAYAEQAKAWSSGLFFKVDDPVMKDAPQASVQPQTATATQTPLTPTQPESLVAGLPIETDNRPTTNQQHKLAFLNETISPQSHLNQPLLYPRSQYEIQAGTIIPAALLTGINTDLPGDVIAQVTSPVYDTVTGEHLLIPQGAKLYGAYDSQISNGQNRALLVWHRLLLPNGRSIQLDLMRGTDGAGYAGVKDRVDYHTGKLLLGAVLSTAIAYTGNLARSDSSGSDNDVGDTIAQEASKIGSSIIERQLDVQPTITIRPGWPLRVLVNKDVLLAPYFLN